MAVYMRQKTDWVEKLLTAFEDPNAKANGFDLTAAKQDSNSPIYYTALQYCSPDASDIDILHVYFEHKKGKKRVVNILSYLGKEEGDIDNFRIIGPEEGVLIIFGSPDSRDIDCVIILFIDGKYDLDHDKPDIDKVRSVLQQIGYDVENRTIDCGLIVVDDNGDVLRTSKGPCSETQNIVFYTWHHHVQVTNDLPIKRPISVDQFDVLDKARSVTLCILDRLKRFLGNSTYKKVREQKRNVYSDGGIARVEFTMELVPLFLMPHRDEVVPKWYDEMKSLIMKLVQLVLLEQGILEYDKTQLPIQAETIGYNGDHIRWFLTRGNAGKFSYATFYELMWNYYRIVLDNTHNIVWYDVDPPSEYPRTLTPEFHAEFCTCMLDASDHAIDLFLKFNKAVPTDTNYLNDVFVEPCTNVHCLDANFVKNHVIEVPQRSKEWRDLLRYYQCGRNSGVIELHNPSPEEFIRHHWNLIRGCIGEQYGTELNFEPLVGPYTSVSVGLLVKHKEQGSPAIAPDLLLVLTDEKVVPVEIKCITGEFAENNAYRREIKIACRQINKAKAILGEHISELGGLIVLVYMSDVITCKVGFV